MEAHEDDLGPIDVALIAYPADAPKTGEAIPLLFDLIERGIVRVLDVLIVVKEADGTFAGFEAHDLDSKGVGGFSEFEGASTGILGSSELDAAADAIEPGTAAVLIMYENRWVVPFAQAVRRNGGQLIANERITPTDLMAALEAVEA
jgi:hypothetical protein